MNPRKVDFDSIPQGSVDCGPSFLNRFDLSHGKCGVVQKKLVLHFRIRPPAIPLLRAIFGWIACPRCRPRVPDSTEPHIVSGLEAAALDDARRGGASRTSSGNRAELHLPTLRAEDYFVAAQMQQLDETYQMVECIRGQ